MKKIALIYFISVFTILAQGGTPPPNSILKNFKPFDTPRTNYRPGTVYRIDTSGIRYIVEDIKSIKSFVSREGSLLGQMTFTKNQILTILNLDFDEDFITAVVEIRNSEREYTEQAMVDNVLWENDKADEIMLDEESRYFIIREAILSNEITYRFIQKPLKSSLPVMHI